MCPAEQIKHVPRASVYGCTLEWYLLKWCSAQLPPWLVEVGLVGLALMEIKSSDF